MEVRAFFLLGSSEKWAEYSCSVLTQRLLKRRKFVKGPIFEKKLVAKSGT
jgi:hypothetical protein